MGAVGVTDQQVIDAIDSLVMEEGLQGERELANGAGVEQPVDVADSEVVGGIPCWKSKDGELGGGAGQQIDRGNIDMTAGNGGEEIGHPQRGSGRLVADPGEGRLEKGEQRSGKEESGDGE